MDIKEILVTKEARVNFLRGLIRLANVDGHVDESEFIFYRQAASVLGLGEQEILELEKLGGGEDTITFNFETDKEKMFFLIQAVQLCWVNDDYSELERKDMRKICHELNISMETLEEVEKWALEGYEWNKRGETLLELH